ncbi:hypothetical protein K456DRAFT_59254, partial [Colletotrichum gloeosporioides 23]
MATVLPARSQGWHDMDCPLHLSPSSFQKPSSEPFHSSPACSPDLPDPIPPKVSSSNNRQYPGPRASPPSSRRLLLLASLSIYQQHKHSSGDWDSRYLPIRTRTSLAI